MTEVDFRALVEQSVDVIAVYDRDHRFAYVNAALERATGVRASDVIGKRNDEAMPHDAATMWREALDHVFATGEARTLECTLDTPYGQRRFASLLVRAGDHACAVTRDVTDVHSVRLLDVAVRTMMMGMVIVDAPSGRILFQNDRAVNVWGPAAREIRDKGDYDAHVAFDSKGQRIRGDMWPVARALAGETVVGERIELVRVDGRRKSISINASPVRDADQRIIAVVATYQDVSEATRAHDAAMYLAKAGALLERFDPSTSLQAIVELAVPVLADRAFVHLKTPGLPVVAAVAHVDREKLAAVRPRVGQPYAITPETAVARVLAGGPAELVQIDEGVIASAARDSAELEYLRRQGYCSAVVAPLAGRDGVLGALTFSTAESGRRYEPADLDMLAELARRTGIALDNARLFAAEQQARQRAEQARDRTRRLQELTARLSGTLEEAAVASILVDAGRAALGAAAGFAWALRGEDVLELIAAETDSSPVRLTDFKTFPLATHAPICDAVKTARPLMFESLEALLAAYPDVVTADDTAYRSWAAIPFVVGGVGVGGVTFSFPTERRFSEEDRELLAAMMGQASLALERCRLLAAERRARAQAEAAGVRERVLHVTAARLSVSQTVAQIAAVVCEQVLAALDADMATAGIRAGDAVKIIGWRGTIRPERLAPVMTLPLSTPLPLCEAVGRSEIVWCAGEAELSARYGKYRDMWTTPGLRSWGAVPFAFEGRTLGALAITFRDERELPAEDCELLRAIGQLAAQAIERANLHEALKASEENLRSALAAARAGTWRVDLRTLTTVRDPSYAAMLGQPAGIETGASFDDIHPDDRPIAAAAFERARRDDTPYAPEVRVLRGDGTYLWTRTYARISRDDQGRPLWIGGITFDIDEAKRASERAEEERRINETLYRLGASFASELDHDRLIRRITEEVTALLSAESGTFSSDRTAFHVGMLLDAPASELSVPVTAGSGDTFGTLSFAHREPDRFTEAQQRLVIGVAAQAAIALENARLYREVRERGHALEQAIDAARLADRRKDEFLAMLGHELRNPLAPITTALDLMDLKGNALTKERDVIRRQVDHMSRLIDDLLDVSRITRGDLELVRDVVELSEIVARAIEMASPLLEKRQQPLSIDVPRDGLAVDADPVRLAQVIHNLLINAAKYSDLRSEIAIAARSDAGAIVIEIRDSGMGIAPELMPQLFEPFVQGARSIDRAAGGLGIGLTIARSLCELHGGSITAASDGPGRGSTFTVRLPHAMRPPTPRSERATEKMPKLSRGMRVLVVDDNLDAASMLQTALAELGHEPAIAHDGVAALELAGTFKPDIAVLDIGLPVMDGYELARRLRDQLGGDKLRLIALTGYGQEADRARAAEAGFDHHLVKPVAIEALTNLLAK